MKNFIITILILTIQVFSQTDSLRISWDPNPEDDMLEYQLFRSRNNAGFNLIQVISHPTTNTVDRNSVAPGGLYEFYLVAVDTGGLSSEPSDIVGVGIPIIIWTVTTIRNDTTILDNNYLLDPNEDVSNLTVDVYNAVNVVVEKTAGGLRLTPLPSDYVGIASFDLVATDPAGFHDDRSLTVEFLESEEIARTKDITIELSP